MNLPFAQGIDPDSGSNALMKAMELSQKKKQDAAANLIDQQKVALDQQKQQFNQQRLTKADARVEQDQRRESAKALMPYVDPNSPSFNPELAPHVARLLGVPLSTTPQGPAPTAPSPTFVGPIPSAHDAMMGALGGTRTDNPNHEGQAFVDQVENGSAGLVGPSGGTDSFNFPASKLGMRAQEGSWVPDPRRGRVYVDQVENGSAHLLPPGGGEAFNAPTGGMPQQPKESEWIRDPRGPADPLPIQNQAAQEAMQQQAERDQYAKQLAEAPARQAKYHQEIADYQQRKQFPAFQMDTGDGRPPMTIDTLALHRQAEGSRQARVEAYKQAYGDNPDALKIAVPMASLGVPDEKIAAAVNNVLGKQATLTEKGREADQTDATRRYGIDARKGRGGAGAGGHGKQWNAEEKELAGELQKYEQTHQLTGKGSLAEKQREVESALREGESNPNGATQLRIMDKFIKTATGLGVRNQSLETYMNHLSGLAGQGEGKLEQWTTGKMGQQQWRTVMDSLRSQLGDLQREGAQANEEYQRIKGSPAGQRHGDLVKRREDEMFSGLAGYAGKNPLVDAAKTSARNQKIQQMGPQDKAAVDWADKHPDDPRSAQILKLHGL